MRPEIRVGCAGWSIARADGTHFPDKGTHLQRYAQVFNAVEINSSFYQSHLPATYRRWAASVPEGFRFSVKFPRSISHERGLQQCNDLLDAFLGAMQELDGKLGCLLLQLPPRLSWNTLVVLPFLDRLQRGYTGPIACEPRHASWFHSDADRQLAIHGISRVAADPALSVRAGVPGGDRCLQYVRLHGSPRMYYDDYAMGDLKQIAAHLTRPSAVTEERWCIFDNTAAGHATANALALMRLLEAP